MSLNTKQMANGTRSSDRAKDEGNSNGRPRQNGEKGTTNLCSSASDTTGVRRSPRDKSSKITPSPSSTQKSKPLEIRTLPSAAVKRKSERVEKQNMPTPLRRSGRTTSHSSLSPSDSKSSASLSSKQRPKKEKSVKQLTFEAKEVNENEEHDLETSPVKVPRMDARRYRAMFRTPNNDCLVESNKIDKSTQEFGVNDEGTIGECSKGSHFNIEEVSKNGMLPSEVDKLKEMRADSSLSGTAKCLVENNLTIGSPRTSNATTSETSVVPQRVQPDSCGDKKLQKLESKNSLLDEDLVRNSVGHDSGENLIPSKRNGTTTDMVLDVSATLANDNNCNLIPSRLAGHIVGTGGSCSKRRRLDFDPTVSCRNESCNPSSNSIDQLKEGLASDIAYSCKSDAFRFVEYWVPVQISDVQLEQYCRTLHSKTSILRSSSKMAIEALRDALSTTWKCCSHPYIVDPSLNNVLILGLKVVEYLDAEIKASGKLQLLDSLLMELKKKNLRALVLFQPVVSGRIIGDILDDFLRLRFGPDSYERIDEVLATHKKQTAMRKFNKKDDGRFVFLLETCACRPIIKLSSVDAIIIFDSDLNPMNDIRSLQKITVDSQFELIKIFRLYSSFTVEENALILAKQDKTLDFNLQNISMSTCHMLLMGSASSLFDDLRAFHDGETSMSSLKSLSRKQLLEEAVREFSFILSQDGEDNDTSNCSIFSRVQQNGATYSASCSLLGEQKLRFLDEEPPHIFWTKLLDGKQFQWRYSHSSFQRSRKRVDRFDGLVNKSVLVSEGTAKKRRKTNNNIVDQPSSKSEGLKSSTGIKTGTYVDPVDRPQLSDFKSGMQTRLHDEQRSLHLLLKPEITKLCEVLHLPDNVKSMVDNFLEYVMNNHRFIWKPVLQAFELSLIWIAAPWLKHKRDGKDSLLLAKQHLNFDCKKGEVEYVHSMLWCLKRIFRYRTGNPNNTGCPKAPESSKRIFSGIKGDGEVELFKKDVSKSIEDIRKKSKKHRMKLSRMQDEEKQRLERAVEDEKDELERRYKIDIAFSRACSLNDVMRTEKLKVLKSEYCKKLEELKHQHETRHKVLEEKQLADMLKYKEKEDAWVEEVQSWAEDELLNIVASKELGTGVEYLQCCEQEQPQNSLKNVDIVTYHFTEGKGHDNTGKGMTRTGTEAPKINSPAVALSSKPVELQAPLIKHTATDGMSNMALQDQSVSRSEGHDRAEDQNDNQGSIITKHSHSRKKSYGATTMTNEGDLCENFGQRSQDGCQDDVLPSSNGEQCDGETSDVPSGEVAPHGSMSNMSSCGFSSEVDAYSNGTKDIASLNSLSPEKHTPSVIAVSLPDSGNAAQVNEADKCNGLNNAITENSPFSDERIADGAISSILDREAPMGMPRTVNVTDCPENATAVNPASSIEQLPDEGALNEGLDRELSRPCEFTTPSNSPNITLVNQPLEQQISDGVSLSTPDGDIPVIMPERSGEVADCHNNIQPLTDTVLVDIGAISNQQEGVPSEQVQHLPSPVVPNQLVVQPDSNSQLDSQSHQVVVDSAANADLASLRPGGVRAEPSNSRSLSTPSDINNHPIQTVSHSASRPSSIDPLKTELERIQKTNEHLSKSHEDMKLQLKSNFEKELEDLRRKYDVKYQEVEVEFQQTKKHLDTCFHMVYVNKILADAFRSKCLDWKASGACGMQQDARFGQQSSQFARQQSAIRPSHVPGPSSCAPSAANLQSASSAAVSQNKVPPMRDTSGVISNAAARLPCLNYVSSPLGNFQVGGGIHAPAPHLQPYRPSTSVPPSSLPALPQGMPSQHTPNNNPASSPPLSHVAPQRKPMTHQSGPNMGHRLDPAGGFRTPNLPAMDSGVNANSQPAINLPNVGPSMLDSSSVPANPSNQAISPGIVCLSDDDD